MWQYNYTKELYHYGVPGMRWGIRRGNRASSSSKKQSSEKNTESSESKKQTRGKTAIKIGAAAVGTALAVYGAKKVHDLVRDKNTAIRISKEYERLITSGLSRGYSPTKDADFLRQLGEAARDRARSSAKSDSFGTALKNVAKSELERLRSRRKR